MKKFIQQFIELMRPYRRHFMHAFIIIMVNESIKLAPPYLFKEVLDTLTQDVPEKLQRVILLAAGVLAAEMMLALINVISNRKILKILYWIEEYIPTKAQEKLMKLSLGYHENEQTGDTITRLERGTWRVAEFAGNLLWHLFPLFVQTMATIVVMMIIDWQLASIFTLAIPIFVALTWRLFLKTKAWRARQEELYTSSAGKLGESVINIKTVQSYAQEPQEQKRYGAMREEINELGHRRMLLGTRTDFYRSAVVNIARFGIIAFAGYKALEGTLSIGSVVLFLTLSEKVYISLFSLNHVLEMMLEATEPIQRMLELMKTENAIAEAPEPKRPQSWRGLVQFKDVSFGYEEGQQVLHNIDLTIKPGETIALAGPSGGGKSTLVKLLFRYYDPTAGKILIDGHDLRELDLRALRQSTGYVPQDIEIMNGSIRDNIAYGKPEASLRDIQRAAEQAHLEDFIESLPQRYDTLVGEGGVKLSGGLKQRVGVARALLVDPTFIVFDEATSNLDAQSQRAVQEAIDQLAGTRTMIIIAHRLSTIMKADKIVVVDNGHIAEVGTHNQLVRRNGLYQRLAQLELEAEH